MNRFVLTIAFNLHLCFIFFIELKYTQKHKDALPLEKRYKTARKIVKTVAKKSRATVIVSGTENLPEENGYVLFSNHQGKFDGIAIMCAHERPLSIVIDEKRSHGMLADRLFDCMDCKRLVKTDARQCIKIFNEISEGITNENRNYLIFPEGIYFDNKNTLQEFKTGCMHFLYKTKCPVVPVCLYDSYKVYNENSLKKVSCKVAFLTPISYEDYKDLDKRQLAELVKGKIQEQLDVFDSQKTA